MREHRYFVYILTNFTCSVLYTGVTNNLSRRFWEHANKVDPKSFTAQYNVTRLVYFEEFNDISMAISREKQIKSGSRRKKILLVRSANPFWVDLQVPQND